jgi:hypothetical protein
MTLLMSAGIVQPGGESQSPGSQARLAALAEAARAAQAARKAEPTTVK